MCSFSFWAFFLLLSASPLSSQSIKWSKESRVVFEFLLCSGDLFPFTHEGDPERSEQRSTSQARRAADCSISDSSSTANVEQTKTVVKRRGRLASVVYVEILLLQLRNHQHPLYPHTFARDILPPWTGEDRQMRKKICNATKCDDTVLGPGRKLQLVILYFIVYKYSPFYCSCCTVKCCLK